MKIYRKLIFLEKDYKKEIKIPVGKDIWVLFFAPIILPFRKQWEWALVSIFTLFLANIFLFFYSNELRIKKYLKLGWIIIDDL